MQWLSPPLYVNEEESPVDRASNLEEVERRLQEQGEEETVGYISQPKQMLAEDQTGKWLEEGTHNQTTSQTKVEDNDQQANNSQGGMS